MSRRVKIAVVGRPNVGKSALFNRICNKKIAIVDESEGVTRDRLYADFEFFGTSCTVIDTGGIDPYCKENYQEQITRQAEVAIAEADTVVMVVDGSIPCTALDEYVAKLLLQGGANVILAVNKIDSFDHIDLVHEFYKLGIQRVIGVSAQHGFQIAELVELALQGLVPKEGEEELADHLVRVAIIGRPNNGKSTFLNHVLGEKRSIVSPEAGTTRDSIDVLYTHDEVEYLLIDTAGIRKKASEKTAVEKFAAIRTERAIERADVCILIADAVEGITTQEKKIARDIEDRGKGCVLLLNKWDLVKGFRMEHCMQVLREEESFLSNVPIQIVSALSGRNIPLVFPIVKKVFEACRLRVSTGQLNRCIAKAMQKNHPPMIGGKRLRVYYLAQIDTKPPRFVLFVNNPNLMLASYKRYLINQLRLSYPFQGAPIIFDVKPRVQKDRSCSTKEVHQRSHEEELEEEFACED